MQSSITTDLQNLFSYAFIERVPYHFIVPKKNNYLELAISERHNCCLSCNNNFITTFKNDTNVFITKDKLAKQESIYQTLGLTWNKPNKGESYIYRQNGFCEKCFSKEYSKLPPEQKVYELAKDIYAADIALINDAKELMAEIIKKWLSGLETLDDVKSLELNTYLDIRNYLLNLCSNDFSINELLTNYEYDITNKIAVLKEKLSLLGQDKLNLFVQVDNSVYESLSDELYNEYTVLMPTENSIGSFYYNFTISVEKINLFLEQERVGNVFDLINEVGFSDIWVEWFLKHITTLNK